MTVRGLLLLLAFCGSLFFTSKFLLVDRELVFNPDRYHGHEIQRGMFFEGWYYNMVLENDSKKIAVIPGILISDDSRYAFMMVAHGNTSHFYRYPSEGFRASPKMEEFRLTLERKGSDGQLQTSTFSGDGLTVNVQPMEGDDATESVEIKLKISNSARSTHLSPFMPGTMGPLSWLSFLQCYHHVLSMQHTVQGSLRVGEYHREDAIGSGYIEKDWGQMFPASWIWGQANHWISQSSSSASIFFSFAIVPTGFGFDLPGSLVIFEFDRQYYRFNSYLLSVVHQLTVDNQTNTMSFTIYDVLFEHKLQVTAHFNDRESGALLYGPRHGRMEKFVKEMLDPDADFDVRLSRLIRTEAKSDSDDLFLQHGFAESILFQGRANHVALEINGNVQWLSEQFQMIDGNTYPWKFSPLRLIVQHYKLICVLIGTLIGGFIVSRLISCLSR